MKKKSLFSLSVGIAYGLGMMTSSLFNVSSVDSVKSNEDSMICNVELTEWHSMDESENEYVCVNVEDRTDFIVIDDSKEILSTFDWAIVTFKDDEMVDYNLYQNKWSEEDENN